MRCGIYVRVSTDDQRDNGYSIDSQLRMIKEYCEKNDYDIVDVYNDAGHSGKDLMRPEMQRLLKDIKSKKIDKLVAIKVDRLTRNNYDGFWLLNYCEEHDVKIELILEPYDVSTANGEMIFGMNLVFGQRGKTETMQEIKKKKRAVALFVIVLICLCGWWAVRKEGFFLDEIYSYGLANSSYVPFLSWLHDNRCSAIFISCKVDSLRCQDQHGHRAFDNLLCVADTIDEIILLVDDRSHKLCCIDLTIAHLEEMCSSLQNRIYNFLCIVDLTNGCNCKRTVMRTH